MTQEQYFRAMLLCIKSSSPDTIYPILTDAVNNGFSVDFLYTIETSFPKVKTTLLQEMIQNYSQGWGNEEKRDQAVNMLLDYAPKVGTKELWYAAHDGCTRMSNEVFERLVSMAKVEDMEKSVLREDRSVTSPFGALIAKYYRYAKNIPFFPEYQKQTSQIMGKIGIMLDAGVNPENTEYPKMIKTQIQGMEINGTPQLVSFVENYRERKQQLNQQLEENYMFDYELSL